MSDELLNSVDALLSTVRTGLPVPAERQRLRLAAGLTITQIAVALRVDSALVRGWEDGSAVPGPDITPAYARLLDGLAARFPAPEQPTAPVQAPAQQQVAPDQNPDGSPVLFEPAPCVQCGRPSVYRAQGRPMHLGGLCRPAAQAPVAIAPQPEQLTPAPVVQPVPSMPRPLPPRLRLSRLRSPPSRSGPPPLPRLLRRPGPRPPRRRTAPASVRLWPVPRAVPPWHGPRLPLSRLLPPGGGRWLRWTAPRTAPGRWMCRRSRRRPGRSWATGSRGWAPGCRCASSGPTPPAGAVTARSA
ncbi:helix-turn-helix domain-containing protein [Kitasatospora gansuensis]